MSITSRLTGRFCQGLVGLLAGLAILAVPALTAAAPASDWYRDSYSSARLVAGQDSLGPAGQTDVGVEIRLPAGWKTYWRTSGEVGSPTRFDWSASKNLDSAKIGWPRPQRFSDFELESYGYEGEVVFPIAVTAKDPSKPVKLVLNVHYAVCKEICTPVDTRLVLDLPSGGKAKATRYAGKIARYRAMVPGVNGEQGLELTSLVQEGKGTQRRLELLATSTEPFNWPDLAVELPPAYRVGVPGVRISLDRRQARISLPLWSSARAKSLSGQTVGITLWDEDGRAVSHDFVMATPGDGGAPADAGQ